MTIQHPIAALASGWANSPRALVRISGNHLLPALLPVIELELLPCHSGRPALCPPPRGVYTARIRHSPAVRWPAVAFWSAAPRSYTGQDMLELLVPGGTPLVEHLLGMLAKSGVREAGPGEFTARAFLNGRLSADQAEGVAALIAARSAGELAAARALISGDAGRRYHGWIEQTARLLALVEAGIDFTDQEAVIPISQGDLSDAIAALSGQIRDHLGSAAGEELRRHQPRAVLIGRPNAGKSTLFNALLGYRRAVASPIPGATRDVLAEPLELSADLSIAPRVLLCDLPGLDADPADQHARAAQTAALEAISAADILILCIPLQIGCSIRSPAAEAADLLRGAVPTGDARPVIVVRTKSDLARPLHNAPATPRTAEIAVSALAGDNLPVLRRVIADAVLARSDACAAGPLVPRHRRMLAHALTELDAARVPIGAGLAVRAEPVLRSPEIIAQHLRLALDALGELTGRISPDDVLGRIFASFCIGK